MNISVIGWNAHSLWPHFNSSLPFHHGLQANSSCYIEEICLRLELLGKDLQEPQDGTQISSDHWTRNKEIFLKFCILLRSLLVPRCHIPLAPPFSLCLLCESWSTGLRRHALGQWSLSLRIKKLRLAPPTSTSSCLGEVVCSWILKVYITAKKHKGL